ncbi:hypothetical protein XENTR_v10023573 [Xenopus tropicalis]|uniref:Olfactory receptor n=1 Tax=Xenopus tropicalis TaxID=8364 RepID=A0A8J0SWS8_XENTR|nr:olfactory receptor 1G1 [Xenopus tropicalis]KAE8578466.1 hypothetical protein XENTR_v10023573 [Xenopus tropicalis]|eukprot:XP_017952733.1 PREDICTED: olfactory receptor 1G1-like [Xenopus tropicalis]
MENQTTVDILVLAGLSDLPSLQLPLFVVFLLIYILTLIGNLLILLLIFTDSHLHTPMYFFLGTLACLDTGYSSVTAPRLLYDLFTEQRTISVRACIAQIYFFFLFATSEVSLLAVMSYDRYIAICHPLNYMQIMRWEVCIKLVSVVLVFAATYSLLQTLLLNKLTFCKSDALQSFFCELPQLLKVSCSDTLTNTLVINILGILFGLIILGVIFSPYISILHAVLKIQSKNMRSKAFSTCSSHLTAVFIFYSTTFFNYFRSNGNDSTDHFTADKVASVCYAILTPFLNPLIYSLRNQELKTSLKKTLQRHQMFG